MEWADGAISCVCERAASWQKRKESMEVEIYTNSASVTKFGNT